MKLKPYDKYKEFSSEFRELAKKKVLTAKEKKRFMILQAKRKDLLSKVLGK